MDGATYDNGESRDVTAVEKTNRSFEPTPRYWVPEREVAERLAAKGWTRGWLTAGGTWRTRRTSGRSSRPHFRGLDAATHCC